MTEYESYYYVVKKGNFCEIISTSKKIWDRQHCATYEEALKLKESIESSIYLWRDYDRERWQ